MFVFADGGRTVSVTGGEFLAKVNCTITSSYGGVLHMYKANTTSFTYTVSGSSGYSTYIVVSDWRTIDSLQVDSRLQFTSNTAGGSASRSVVKGEYYILIGGNNFGFASGSGFEKIYGQMSASGSVMLVKATSSTITLTAGPSWGLTALGCRISFN